MRVGLGEAVACMMAVITSEGGDMSEKSNANQQPAHGGDCFPLETRRRASSASRQLGSL
jgi:hypothetical protein